MRECIIIYSIVMIAIPIMTELLNALLHYYWCHH